jgi:hypothetical protein
VAKVHIIDPKTIRIEATMADAIVMVKEASENIEHYAQEIVTIYEKMPEFEYTYFCFYAYDTAQLFEKMLQTDPKQYLSFSMDAPDSFFYALYGGMGGLYGQAKRFVEEEREQEAS